MLGSLTPDHMRRKEGYTQLVNAMNRELIEALPKSIGTVEGIVMKGTITVTAAGATGVIAAVGAIFLLTNPAGWVVLGVAAVGAVAGGVAGYGLAGNALDAQRERANALSNELRDIVEKVYLIQLEYLKSGETGARPQINAFITLLQDRQYITSFSQYSFEFGRSKFEQIAGYYDAPKAAETIRIVKFLILFSVASLPPSARPTDTIISQVTEIADTLEDQVVKNTANLILGRLNFDKDDLDEACKRFGKISKGSDLYGFAQKNITLIRNSSANV